MGKSIAETDQSKLEDILKEFLDEVDYTLEVETPGVGDKDFYERPFVQAKKAITHLIEQRCLESKIRLLNDIQEESQPYLTAVTGQESYAIPITEIRDRLAQLTNKKESL